MSDRNSQDKQGRPPMGARRRKTLVSATVTVLAVTAVVVLVNLLATRFSARVDITRSGDQRLAQRTLRLLSRIDQPFRIVIATDLNAVDRRSRVRLNDVLNEVKRASSNVDYTFVDTGSVAGTRAFRSLIEELVKRDEKLIREQTNAIELTAAGTAGLSTYLNDTLSLSIREIQESISSGSDAGLRNRAYFEQMAAGARLMSRDLAAASGKAGDALKTRLDEIPLPSTDVAAGALAEVLTGTVDQLTSLSREMARFAESDIGKGASGDLCRALIPKVDQRRDQAALMVETMRRLKRLDLMRVVEVLRRGSAALVIGPSEVGLTAIDLESLLPSTAWVDVSTASKADLNRRVEELVATSLAALISPKRPIVVLVHGESRPFLEQIPVFAALSRRLQLRGIDLLEWAAAVDTAPARLTVINPDGNRPVVYVCFSPDSSAAASNEGGLSGTERAGRLGQVFEQLASAGQNLLVCINPSVLPTYGEQDPIVKPLARFGLAAESGRPLLREYITPQGRLIETDPMVQPLDSAHPIAGAIRGLPTLFTWPISLVERAADDKVRLSYTPLFAISAGESLWTESQWLRLWQTPRDQRTGLPDLPQFDEGRDGRYPQGRASESAQRWVIAASVERNELGAQPQRLIAVGSNGWFADAVTQKQVNVDGRTVVANPGNLEFFESAIYWLSGQDELIAQSPTARSVAIIKPIEQSRLTQLRAAIILGLPLIVLLVGGFYRFVRG